MIETKHRQPMTTAIETLVAKWAEPGGIPYKGKLISEDGCMCAQGQALHYIGGWTDDRLRRAGQVEADVETAKLLGISRAHVVLLRKVNDGQPGAPSVVLTDPAVVLGDQAETILAFWRHLDRTTTQWAAAGAAWDAAWDAPWDAAGAAGAAARAAAGAAAGAAARGAAWACCEIQGAAIMRQKGQPFYFLPMFGFADPDAVLLEPINALAESLEDGLARSQPCADAGSDIPRSPDAQSLLEQACDPLGAISYALKVLHPSPINTALFLQDWQVGDFSEWKDYLVWVEKNPPVRCASPEGLGVSQEAIKTIAELQRELEEALGRPDRGQPDRGRPEQGDHLAGLGADTSGGRSVTRVLRASLEFAVVAACVYLVIRLLAIWGG